MFFHLRVFMHSLIFFLILRLVATKIISEFLSSLVLNNLFLLLLLVMGYGLIITISVLKIGKRFNMLPIPIILAISSVGLMSFIDSDVKKFIFICSASIVYYLCLLGIYRIKSYNKDETARGAISLAAVVAIFIFYASVFGVYLNFSIPLWIVMVFFLIPTTLVSYQYLQLIENNSKRVWLYSLIIGISMTELSWVLNFWPFGYLTTGVIMLIFYYVIWDLAYSYFLKIMSKRRVVTNIIFFGILVTVVLMSSKWLPVI